jgi:hypothetical protein
MNNKELILNEFEQLKGQFVITESWEVERLVAIGEDEMDYYYITYDGRKLKFHTCVGRIIPLKGKIDDKHYNEFERIANLNHYDRFITDGKEPILDDVGRIYTIDQYKSYLMTDWRNEDKLLTDIIFKSE